MHGATCLSDAPRPQARAVSPAIVGQSPWVRQLLADIALVAAEPCSVLITGQSGTGKELIARSIHAHSKRADGPFIPVDCAAVAGPLFASHLFGHVKGAFTGATYSSLGCFRAASGGTLFLDEVGEFEPEFQAKLLRTLQEHVVVPLGSHEEYPIDVRVIAATNRNLAADVETGRFRLDLYYRLNVVSLKTVPLKDRPEDLRSLVKHILGRLSDRNGCPPIRVSEIALRKMRDFDWPGNVRQLENVLERAVLFSDGSFIGPEHIPCLKSDQDDRNGTPAAVPEAEGPPSSASADGAHREGNTNWPTLAEVERDHILRTLARTGHNQSAAAKLLGIDRFMLRRRIQKYGIMLASEAD